MRNITCKFGGTSLADAACMRDVQRIVDAGPHRRFVVPSAPGKRHAADKKITDLLYAWHNMAHQGLDAGEPRRIIRDRFSELAGELGVPFDIGPLLDEIEAELARQVERARDTDHPEPADYMASRGEYLNGRLMAALLGATFVDPAECIHFDAAGRFDERSYAALGARLAGPGRFVVPGFYGTLPNGRIKTFSRGGSDITGAIVARATGSSLYENWTDVSGFLMADPRIVDQPKPIREITYQELRELSYMGATVLHDEAIFPVREPGIPINIRNTKRPEDAGSMIVRERVSTGPVCGIAGRKGFSMLNIEKTFMNKERGFGLKVLRALDEAGVSWEHMPTGIDTISLIIKDEELDGRGAEIVADIQRRCAPDAIRIEPGLAIIATVGQGMHHHVGLAATLFRAIADAGVNLRVIDQGSSEINIIIGVDAEDFETTVRAIYKAFKDA